MLGIHQYRIINKWLWKRQVYPEVVFPGELPAVSINRCAQKHSPPTFRKNRGRERARRLNIEERTPSWLEPGYGHDTHSSSKWNSHLPNLQLSPCTSHMLPVNLYQHKYLLRETTSWSQGSLPIPCCCSSCPGICSFHPQSGIWKTSNALFLSATRNHFMALPCNDAKWKYCIWNAASSFQKQWAHVPCRMQ